MKKRGGKKSAIPWLITGGLVLLAVVVVAVVAWLLQGKNIAVLNPQGVVAAAEKDLIVFTLLLSVVVVVPVFFMLGFFAWRYREGNHKAKYTPDYDSNKWIEGLWWGIPILIIGVLGVVTWVSTHQLDPYKALDSDKEPITVQVIALQWKWLFLYPEQNVAAVNELKIPVDTPINFEITADGPMSGFWIPNLGSQTYAMNGMSAKLSLMADHEGSYRGSNSNISGTGYADMNFMAEAIPRETFDQWTNQLEGGEQHDNLDSGVYEELAKPGSIDSPRYFHLHDTDLYAKVVNKYAHASGTAPEHHGHE